MVFHHLVKSAQISLEQVAAHYAIGSLFTPYGQRATGLLLQQPGR